MTTLTVGERVVRTSGKRTVGTIERIIPGHQTQYPPRWLDARAVVAWPSRRLGSESALTHSTVALASLARPDEMGDCSKCGRHRRIVAAGQCGTCHSREARRINTAEMWGHGRRGY